MSITWTQEQYTKAYRFAAEVHNGQKFPGTELPYIMHLSFVCMEIIAALIHEPERDGNLAIQCALLHDVIEDARSEKKIDYKKVKLEFGIEVADGVKALTKNKKKGKHKGMQDSLRRIQEQSDEVWMVKLADRITNLAPPPDFWTKEKKEHYKAEAIEINQALGKSSAYLSERLLRKIQEYDLYL
jgi:(p)ppGpp synthase/HD superfamily hydrolase